jgi:gliding motility-associated-like protein
LCELIEGVTLDAGNPGSQFLWSNGMTTQTITVTEPGTYWVNVINNSNCNLSDTIEVVGETGGGVLYVPNTFTPNENGTNDKFFAVGSSVNTFEMQIFNRWGQLIYTSNDINAGWDGKYKGQYVQMDTYVVRIEYTTECDGLRRMKRITHVNVLR